jgi:hypothetical protein
MWPRPDAAPVAAAVPAAPLVFVTRGTVYPHRVAGLRAALALSPGAATQPAIAAAARRLFDEPGFAEAARGIGAEIGQMPDADACIALLASS